MPDHMSLIRGRVFLTGGTGFLGKAILKKLLQTGDQRELTVTVLSRDPDSFLKLYPEFSRPKNLSFVRGDILTFPFSGSGFTHLIHAATDTNRRSASAQLEFFDEILGGTRRALEFAVASGVKRFLLVSSGAVYGLQPPDLISIPESYPGAPSTSDLDSVYGQAKRASEQLCSIYYHQFGLECLIARCFSFVGDYTPLNGQFAIGDFIRDALSRTKMDITVCGDGNPIRSYLHTDDCGDWLVKILLEGRVCRPYNVGSDEPISMLELAHLVRDLLAPAKSVVTLKQQNPESRPRYVPSIQRIRKELNVTISKNLRQAIFSVTAARA